MKWEWKAPWMLALLTLQNVPALQLLHCRPLAQSPAEKHQNYVLDHVFLPQHPSIVFSVLSLLLALGALVPVRRAPRSAHPKRVPPRVRRAARFGLWSITTPHRELKVRPRVSQLRGKEIMWDCPWQSCSVWRLLEQTLSLESEERWLAARWSPRGRSGDEERALRCALSGLRVVQHRLPPF